MTKFNPPTVPPLSATAYYPDCVCCHGKGTIIELVSSDLNPRATNITIEYCECFVNIAYLKKWHETRTNKNN